MTLDELQALADRVQSLSPANRLRLAAELIERGHHDIARPLVEQIGAELTLLHLTKAGWSDTRETSE